MEYSKIITKLKKYHPHQKLSFDADVDIFFFQLSEKEKTFKQNALYICNVSRLPKLQLAQGLSFLCIRDAEIPEEYLSQKNKINLVTIDDSINQYDVIGILSRIFSDEARINNARSCLINALHSGLGLQHIVNEAFRLLQNPIIVSDIGYKILAMCQNPVENAKNSARIASVHNITDDPDNPMLSPLSQKRKEHTEEDEIIPEIDEPDAQKNLGYLIEDAVHDAKREKMYEHIRETHTPYYSSGSESNYGRINSLVYIHGIEVAEVAVVGSRHAIDEVDIETTDFLCKIIGLELRKDDFYQNNQGLMHSFLLFDLLNGQVNSMEAANERMKNLGWKLQEKLAIMFVADLSREIFDGKAQIICKQLHNLLSTSRWVIYDGKIVFLMSFKEELELSSNPRLTEYLEKNSLVASISSTFSNLMEIQKHYFQACKAFELGNKIAPGSLIYNYEDYVLYHICNIVEETHDIKDFYHQGVVAIRDYDKQHGSNFLETLSLYLECSEKAEEIAKRLFIHKNTVLYRVNKLKEQFGINLESGDEKLRIMLTIKLMELEN